MERLDDIADEIENILDEKDAVREVALKSSRTVVRICGRAIRAMHKGKDASILIQEAQEELQRLLGITRTFIDIQHAGFVETAMQEFVEAMVLDAIMNQKELPSPDSLGVTPEAYLMGIGDVIGEIRRQTLDNIRGGNVNEATKLLDIMDTLYEFLLRFHYPSSLVAVKRKQDIARGVIEKTRGEVAVAVRTLTLEKKLKGA
jgi:translin